MANKVDNNSVAFWNNEAKALIGKRIVSAGYMTDEELRLSGWSKRALIIEFDDGTTMYASADDEGNDAGALFTTIEGLEIIPTI
jgi:hypothetical protein